jgi:hypothetical protein
VGWSEVPPRLCRVWRHQNKVSKRQLKLNWEAHQ